MIDTKHLRAGEYWYGSHKGIAYEIKSWGMRETLSAFGLPEHMWNYYIYLNLAKINPADAKKLWLRARANEYMAGRKHYNYWDCEPLKDIEMAGGITWYHKEYSLSDERTVVIGCDYAHAWNIGTSYELADILIDIEKSIESVLARFPELAQ